MSRPSSPSALPASSLLPVAFRASRNVKLLNIVATASSLAVATGAGFSILLARTPVGAISAVTTLACALVWAWLVRFRSTNVAGVGSFVLAAVNAATAYCVFYVVTGATGSIFVGALVVTVVGSVIWLPALGASWIVFGRPVQRAKAAAERGLGSEDRGERKVAIVSLVVALLSIFVLCVAPNPVRGSWNGTGSASLAGPLACWGIGLIAVVTSLLAVAATTRRERARATFLQTIREGGEQMYRLEPAPGGREILLRVHVEEHGYRVAPLYEEIVEIGSEGDALRIDRSV